MISIFKKNLLEIILLMAIALSLSSIWSILTPLNGVGPDEPNHLNYAGFLAKNHRLPNFSQEPDLIPTVCGNTLDPCYYSEAYQPPLAYLIYALPKILTGDRTLNFTPSQIYQARFISALFYALYLIFLYSGLKLFLRKIFKNQNNLFHFLPFLIAGFLPSVVFLSAYVNLDIFSLSVAAFLFWSVCRFLAVDSHKWSDYLLLGLSFALLFQSKPTFLFFGLLMFIWLIYNLLSSFLCHPELACLPVGTDSGPMQLSRFRVKPCLPAGRPGMTNKGGKINLLWIIGALIVILVFNLPWWWHNWTLYRDPLLNKTLMNLLKSADLSATPIAQGYGLRSLSTSPYFMTLIFKSFLAAFGPITVYLSEWFYLIMKIKLILLSFLSLGCLFFTKDKRIIVFSGLLILTFTAFHLFIANRSLYSFQAQGRYYFPLLIPLAIFWSYGVLTLLRNHPFTIKIINLIATTGFLAINIWGLDLFSQHYYSHHFWQLQNPQTPASGLVIVLLIFLATISLFLTLIQNSRKNTTKTKKLNWF